MTSYFWYTKGFHNSDNHWNKITHTGSPSGTTLKRIINRFISSFGAKCFSIWKWQLWMTVLRALLFSMGYYHRMLSLGRYHYLDMCKWGSPISDEVLLLECRGWSMVKFVWKHKADDDESLSCKQNISICGALRPHHHYAPFILQSCTHTHNS